MPTIPDLIARSVDGVFAIDAGQTVVSWNNACEGITGIPADQAIGRRCQDVLKGHDLWGRPLCKCDCPLGSLVHGGPPPPQLPMRITHAQGQSLQIDVGTLLIPSSVTKHWSVVHVLRRGRKSRPAGMFTAETERDDGIDGKGSPAGVERDSGTAAALTLREREILRLLADGTATDGIAGLLHISVTTVRNHVQRLMAKLHVHTRLEAVSLARRHQLI